VALEWLDEDTLASAGWSDQTIKIWSSNKSQTKRKINTFTDVFSLKLLKNKVHLVAGLNLDIKIYNINYGNLVSTLKGHSDRVNNLVQMSDDLLASSSGDPDKSVRIWNLTTNKCKFILTGHTNWVNGLKQITPSILASGCWLIRRSKIRHRKIVEYNIG
jgi:WD40 repeat protein